MKALAVALVAFCFIGDHPVNAMWGDSSYTCGSLARANDQSSKQDALRIAKNKIAELDEKVVNDGGESLLDALNDKERYSLYANVVYACEGSANANVTVEHMAITFYRTLRRMTVSR